MLCLGIFLFQNWGQKFTFKNTERDYRGKSMDKNSHSIQQRDTIDGKVQNGKMYPSFGNIVSIRHLDQPKFHRNKNRTIYKIYSYFDSIDLPRHFHSIGKTNHIQNLFSFWLKPAPRDFRQPKIDYIISQSNFLINFHFHIKF